MMERRGFLKYSGSAAWSVTKINSQSHSTIFLELCGENYFIEEEDVGHLRAFAKAILETIDEEALL